MRASALIAALQGASASAGASLCWELALLVLYATLLVACAKALYTLGPLVWALYSIA